MSGAAEAARAYIAATHGALPTPDLGTFDALVSDSLVFKQEVEKPMGKDDLKGVFMAWAAIVDGESTVQIHTIAESGNVALAHWETSYDVLPDQTWYDSDADISCKTMRGFTVFASFTVVDGMRRHYDPANPLTVS